MRVPLVKEFYPPPENLRWYKQQILTAAKAASAASVDESIAKEEMALKATVAATSKQSASEDKPPKQRPWGDMLGKE